MLNLKEIKKRLSFVIFIFGEASNIVGLINAIIYGVMLSTIFTAACGISMLFLLLISLKWKNPDIFIRAIVIMVGGIYFPIIFMQTATPTTFVYNVFIIPVSYAITINKKKDLIWPILNLVIYNIFFRLRLEIPPLLIFNIIYIYVLVVPAIFSLIISSYSKQLTIENERVSILANRDALTGLYNRTYLSQFYNNYTCTPIMTDIDFFKKINDTYGHDEGDKILKNLAEIFLKYKEEDFKIFRYGGEEFMIISNLEDDILSKRIIEIVEDVRKNLKTKDGNGVTISVGIGTKGIFNETAIKSADINLYLCKNSGRNCIFKDNELLYK